jgi:hypothetical protein
MALCGLLLAGSPPSFAADTVYQEPASFLEEYLPGCRRQALWLDKDAKVQVEDVVGHPFPGVRVRYCEAAGKTAWILDEIGKTEPITSGVVVDQGHEDAVLEADRSLDRPIDGITGATLSVWALNRQVRLALLLDAMVREKSSGDAK